MKRFTLFASFASLFLLGIAGSAAAQPQTTQKGVDAQTRKIKDDTQKATSREHDVGRSFDWGRDKTKVRDRLDNPFKFNIRRDALIELISEALQEKRILVDEAASRMKEGMAFMPSSLPTLPAPKPSGAPKRPTFLFLAWLDTIFVETARKRSFYR